MSWATASKKKVVKQYEAARPTFPTKNVDFSRLVALDFETYYDADYTLSKLSTSEYIRDPRFEALMMGVKVGKKKRVVIPGPKIKAFLASIPWLTHSVLCHNVQFDGFILSHHYKVVPEHYYCTLSMARGLHSNEIGAGLDEVAKFYGREGKLTGSLEDMKGRRYKELVGEKHPTGFIVYGGQRIATPTLYAAGAEYCGVDVDEMLGIFEQMLPKMPEDEIDLIDLTARMFCDPVLKVDLPRVKKELERELLYRKELLLSVAKEETMQLELVKLLLKTKAERGLEGDERRILLAKRLVGSNEKFADLLRAEGVEPPTKISPAWMKKPTDQRTDEDKYAYAFAKDDAAFINLPDDIEALSIGLNLAKVADVKKLAARQARLRNLVDCRLAVKSTTNVTRAERFLTAGANGMPLPVGYAYYRAHCLTGDAQVLTAEGWERLDAWTGGDIAQWSEDGVLRFAPATPNSFEVDEQIAVANARYHRANYTLGHTLPAFTAAGMFAPRKAGAAFGGRFQLPITGDLDGAAPITEIDAMIAAMVQADGSIRTDVALGRHVRFGFKKQRKIDRCVALLNEAHVPHSVSVEKGGATRIFIGAKNMHLVLELLDPETKEFLPALLQAPLSVKRVFIDELTHWDGSIEPHHKGFTYTTTSERNAVFVQTVAHLIGKSAFVTAKPRTKGWLTAHNVYIRGDQTTRSIPKHYSLRRHRGTVYCPTTQTGYFLMRQNGCIVVTGNTGRWGGNNKMNMQNLTRGGELRLSILAAAAHHVCVADSGQIECRVNAWLWGQDDLLKAFREADAGKGRDAYCNFADDIYGRTITKADTLERFVGKVSVLGLGFQMGAPKFQMTLAKGALGGPPVFFELDRCKAIVNTYRRKNFKIAGGWEICKRIIEDMAAGRTGSHKCITWEKETIWLPNGMSLKYPDLKKRMGDKGWEEWTYQSGDQRKKIYGGLLCENIVQALARIIVAWQMLQISRKYRVVMTTHDEVVVHVRKTQADKAQAFMLKMMRTPLDWCSDIPLNAEGGHDANYSK